MRRSDHHWLNETRIGRATLFAFFLAVILFFAAATFLILRALTGWPTWLLIVITLPTGLLVFVSWAKAHETNGFDGVARDRSREDEDRGGPAAT